MPARYFCGMLASTWDESPEPTQVVWLDSAACRSSFTPTASQFSSGIFGGLTPKPNILPPHFIFLRFSSAQRLCVHSTGFDTSRPSGTFVFLLSRFWNRTCVEAGRSSSPPDHFRADDELPPAPA
jgi:hypothetical protein